MSFESRLARLEKASEGVAGPTINWAKLAHGDPTWAAEMPPPPPAAERWPALVCEVRGLRARLGRPDPDDYDALDLVEEVIRLTGRLPAGG